MKGLTLCIVAAVVIVLVAGSGFNKGECADRCPNCGTNKEGEGDFCVAGCGNVYNRDDIDQAGKNSGDNTNPTEVGGVCRYGGGSVAPGTSGAPCTPGGYCSGCRCADGSDRVNGFGDGTLYPDGTRIIDDCCHLSDEICEALIPSGTCPPGKDRLKPSDLLGTYTYDNWGNERDCVPASDDFEHGDGKTYGWGNCCTCDCDDGDTCTDDRWDPDSGTCVNTPRCKSLDILGPDCVQVICVDGTTPEGECDTNDEPIGAICNSDDNLCTIGTCLADSQTGDVTCSDGPGSPMADCVSENTCESGHCDEKKGCLYDLLDVGDKCLSDGDGDVCTIKDKCVRDGDDIVCAGEPRCEDGTRCDSSSGKCVSGSLALVGAGAVGAAVCLAVAAGGFMTRRSGGEDTEEWSKMSSGSSFGNKRMTTATQMSTFTRGGGSSGSRSSRSSKGKRMTGVTQMSGGSRGAMMGLEGVSSGSRGTMGTTHSQMSRATRSTTGSHHSRNSRGSKGRSYASGGTRSSQGSRGSRGRSGSRGRH